MHETLVRVLKSVKRRLWVNKPLQKRRFRGFSQTGPLCGNPRNLRFAPTKAPVSIIIPTAGQIDETTADPVAFVSGCVHSIRRLSTYKHYEIILVDSGPISADLKSKLYALGVRRIAYPLNTFNFSEACNLGAAHAVGDYLLFLNDDTEVISPDWIERLFEYAANPELGAVGAKLFFPDNRIQHAGVHIIDGNPGHDCYGLTLERERETRDPDVARYCPAVTGACLMTRRAVFEQIGGFDWAFPLHYNDVDLCLRIREEGYHIVYTPLAQLYHHEGMSKPGSVLPWELELFKKRWAEKLRSPNHRKLAA